MTFKQISVVSLGEKGYTILVYALSEDGNLYVLKTGPSSPDRGEWKQVQGSSS